MTIRNLNTTRIGMTRALDRVGFPHVSECGNGGGRVGTIPGNAPQGIRSRGQRDASGSPAVAVGDAMT